MATNLWQYKTLKLHAEGWFAGGKVDERLLEAEMNRLGAEGWELATAFDTNMHHGQTRDVVALFKRPVVSQ